MDKLINYDNRNNPFNDPHLEKVFVWKKKAKRLGWSKSEAKAFAEEQRIKNIPEIENAKRRRVERENELAAKLEEREKLDRERISSSHEGWEAREEDFMLRQHQQASAIRINQGRERPVDVVARNVLLTKQLRFTPEIGPDGKARDLLSSDVGIESTSPLELFSKLSRDDLRQLREDIAKYCRLEGEKGQFAPFWRALLLVCEDQLKPKDSNTRVPEAVRTSICESCASETVEGVRRELREAEEKASNQSRSEEDRAFFKELAQCLRVEEARALVREIHAGMIETAKMHGRAVHAVKAFGQDDSMAFPARVMLQEEDEDENQMEGAFNDLVELPAPPPDAGWVQPRFWNRIRTGYDWNKYNRAHFDKENPPPKSVMGYRFNIMYPDLKRTPTFRLEADPTDPQNFSIIRFCASRPYTDLAFRIENREWDRGARSGFKSAFENGVLQLHFNFTRRRYRR